jgi:hypothetical protein
MQYQYPILFFLLIALSSCCGVVDCDSRPNAINILVMQDGHNALFGPEATLSQDSILFRREAPFSDTLFFYTNGVSQTLVLPFEFEGEYLLEFKNIRVDTLSGIIGHRDVRGKCNDCDHYFWESFSINGHEVCVDDCQEDLILEL